MTYSIIVGKYKLIFSDTHFKDFRKKPTISVYDADTNSETKIASFNSQETFEWFVEAVVEADRKTESCSEKPNNCETCRHKHDGTIGYCKTCGESNYEPKDEPQTDYTEQCSFCVWRGKKDCMGDYCPFVRAKGGQQTERSE